MVRHGVFLHEKNKVLLYILGSCIQSWRYSILVTTGNEILLLCSSSCSRFMFKIQRETGRLFWYDKYCIIYCKPILYPLMSVIFVHYLLKRIILFYFLMFCKHPLKTIERYGHILLYNMMSISPFYKQQAKGNQNI